MAAMHHQKLSHAPVERRLVIVQHRPVLMDWDLARLLALPLGRLRGLVWEYYEQFPGELCFQPEAHELPVERRQPHASAFTEQGVWMVATVLGTRAALELAMTMSRACAACREQRRFSVAPEPAAYR